MADITLLTLTPPPSPQTTLPAPAAPNDADDTRSAAAAHADPAAATTTFAATLKEKIDQPTTRQTKQADSPGNDTTDAATPIDIALAGVAIPMSPMPTMTPVPPGSGADPALLIAQLRTVAAKAEGALHAPPAGAVTPAPTFAFAAIVDPGTRNANPVAAPFSEASTAVSLADHMTQRPLTAEQLSSHDKLAVAAAISAAPPTANTSPESPSPATATPTALAAPMSPLAPAAENAAATPMPPMLGRLEQSGWADELGQRLTWMIGNHRQQAELILSPPHLGHLEISLKLTGDQASASFVSSHPAVREAVEQALPRLREILSQAGVTLGQTHVGAEQRQYSPNREHSATADFATRVPSSELSAMPTVGGMAQPRSGGRGMVDVFA